MSNLVCTLQEYSLSSQVQSVSSLKPCWPSQLNGLGVPPHNTRPPRLGSLIEGSEVSLLWKKLCNIIIFQLVGLDYIAKVPLLLSRYDFLFAFMCGISFLIDLNLLCLWLFIVILVLPWEEVSSSPSLSWISSLYCVSFIYKPNPSHVGFFCCYYKLFLFTFFNHLHTSMYNTTNLYIFIGASLVAQMVKNLPAMQETPIWSLGQEDPVEKGIATHTNIFA